ncbi:MAG: putative metal-binding motif-containing protein [Myxococcales bacterium]|nr:putative metal-binding motif-containing protein [Myxococcales bacterium]
MNPLVGPYACSEAKDCGDGGLLCDDGVCCNPQGEPLCLSHVLDGGTCADGGLARYYYLDQDGDSFGNQFEPRPHCSRPAREGLIEQGGDCNDGNPGIHPAAYEVCDEVDNDCDGQTDEGLPSRAFWLDQDRDTYGAPDASVEKCTAPFGYVERPGDCWPEDPARNPEAPESCNSEDDDCDGQTDEGVSSPYYPDGDGDGYGSGTAVQACSAPLGHVAQSGDCDEGNSAINPGRLDVCDGADNNCSGSPDERPDCGGQADLLTAPGLDLGAQNVGFRVVDGVTYGCLKDRGTAYAAEPFSLGQWKGAGYNLHVAWAEAPRMWDLSRSGLSLRLKLRYSISSNTSPPWESGFNQPQVILCGPAGHVRYRPYGATMLGGNNGTVDTAVPLQIPLGTTLGGWWADTVGSQNADPAFLRRVKRVEVFVEPEAASPPASFTIDFLQWGFFP